jgi:hypothetical protein
MIPIKFTTAFKMPSQDMCARGQALHRRLRHRFDYASKPLGFAVKYYTDDVQNMLGITSVEGLTLDSVDMVAHYILELQGLVDPKNTGHYRSQRKTLPLYNARTEEFVASIIIKFETDSFTLFKINSPAE